MTLRGSSAPVTRIRRSRAKGSRQPQGTLYVGRPTRFGNPFPVADSSREEAVAQFKIAFWAGELDVSPESVRADMAGYRHLSCWCPLDKECHADEYIKALTAA